MELNGTKLLDLPCDSVWCALNDPSILIQCVPDCESFERVDENVFELVLAASVGPITARFVGKLSLTHLDPPHGYSMDFSGSGGAAGTGKGTAVVRLIPQGTSTVLNYKVNAHVKGRLAQVGSRLIDAVAAKMAEEFFSRFRRVVSAPTPSPLALDNETYDVGRSIEYLNKSLHQVIALSLLIAALITYFLFD
jgi:carbon monoxide dehydrogenase subunit G